MYVSAGRSHAPVLESLRDKIVKVDLSMVTRSRTMHPPYSTFIVDEILFFCSGEYCHPFVTNFFYAAAEHVEHATQALPRPPVAQCNIQTDHRDVYELHNSSHILSLAISPIELQVNDHPHP